MSNDNLFGKEYDSSARLLFEGEFLKKKRWKGKINNYYKNALIFEGEILDGEIWSGKGKEYETNGKISFEGEYINGKKMVTHKNIES